MIKIIGTCAEQFDFLNIEVLCKIYEAQRGPIHQQDHVPFRCQKKSATLLLYFGTSQTRGKPGSYSIALVKFKTTSCQ